MTDASTPHPRDRILRAATELLERDGREGVSTRAVSSAAGVQAPTIYRLFGDMRGLLDAVASSGFAAYLESKTSRGHTADPVEDLRQGWDIHVEFGLGHPALYALIYGEPGPERPPAARQALLVLQGLVARVAAAGRLRVTEERAAQMIISAGSGLTLALISTKPEDRDPQLSALVREAVLTAITTEDGPGTRDGDAPGKGSRRAAGETASHAVALKAALPRLGDRFTSGEIALLSEWLDRAAR